jgi:hypothetical protein
MYDSKLAKSKAMLDKFSTAYDEWALIKKRNELLDLESTNADNCEELVKSYEESPLMISDFIEWIQKQYSPLEDADEEKANNDMEVEAEEEKEGEVVDNAMAEDDDDDDEDDE